MPTISAVIPVFNAEHSLEQLLAELKSVLGKIDDDYEIIFVEDFSTDRSWEIVKTQAENNQRVRSIRLSRNFGQHNALLCGYEPPGRTLL